MKILIVAGARPNFMKIAPLIHELEKESSKFEFRLIHTGQHYDYAMSKVFFDDLGIPEPNYHLNVGSGSHSEQTANVMVEFEKVCLDESADLVVVVGDVNSTLACSITAKKLNIKVAHVEAGLRSGDMAMPEEINRIVTDSISDYLFVTEPSGMENLKKEGRSDEEIFFVGNIMIDNLHYCLNKLKENGQEEKNDQPYGVVTLHRPSNVDNKEKLSDIINAICEVSKDYRIYFPVHPRTAKNLEEFGLKTKIDQANITLEPPLSYMKFLSLWKGASLVLTDSGGLQEETTALGIPCFTMRENTERPITIHDGTNTLVGTDSARILKAYGEFKTNHSDQAKIPDLWDGNTASRIVKIFEKF